MILTCHQCPKQLCFHGSARDRFARLFGWVVRGGRYFCAECASLNHTEGSM